MNDAMQDVNVLGRAKRSFLYSFVVFLVISALLAITSVFSGDFGEFELKVLATTSVIAGASICGLCCGMYASRGKNPQWSVVGAAFAALAAAMLILGVWAEPHSDSYWKTTGIVSVYAIAFAHSLALLAVRLRPTHAWLRTMAAGIIFVLATLISFMIAHELHDKSTSKLVAVLAILVALATLVIPIMARLGEAAPGVSGETLSLRKREDGRYEDKNGRLYEVKELPSAPGQTTPDDAPAG